MILLTRPKKPIARHLSHDSCRTVFSVVSQTIAATPPLLSVQKWPRAIQRRALEGGIAERIASEAYRAIGGIAWNSIANRAEVGHQANDPNLKLA